MRELSFEGKETAFLGLYSQLMRLLCDRFFQLINPVDGRSLFRQVKDPVSLLVQFPKLFDSLPCAIRPARC